MELTMTRLLLVTIVGAILPVSMVSAGPWRARANKKADLQDALDFLKKHLSDKGIDLPSLPGSRMASEGFPSRTMGGYPKAETMPIYDPRFNFGNQRETADIEPVEMIMNDQLNSDDEVSDLESADLDLEDSISSEGELVDDIIADIITKEIIDDIDNALTNDDETDNINNYYTEDESPTVSFDYNEEMENYERFLEQQMENKEETPIDNNNVELDEDILNEIMMTYLENDEDGNEQTRNDILVGLNEDDEGDINTQTVEEEAEEEELIIAENILREIEDELQKEKIKQQSLSKKKALQAVPKAPPATCPVLDYLVDDCEIAAVDGIGGNGYRQAFSVPCNWHQVCYTCGYSYGISQEICDEAFYLEMLARCGNSQACSDRADFFLVAVVEDRVPLLRSSSVCQNPCLTNFLLGLDE
ncbi:uncharacterized protein [Antedon mediterranea]|uniref:uncharacterized protein isoform X2 n=1 Tax=Antedon mediterranea TaxID=105859 RepID=UPI003AF6668E